MIVLKILALVLLIFIALLAVLIITPMGVSVKYRNEKSDVYIHIGLIKLNVKLFTKKRKTKYKKQSLKKHLKSNKSDTSKAPPTTKPDVKTAHLQKHSTKASHKGSVKCESIQKTTVKKQSTAPEKSTAALSQAPEKSFISKLSDSFKGASPSDILDLITKTLSDIKAPLARHTRVKIKKLRLCICTDDAAKTAMLYGVACMAYQSIFELCEKFSVLKVKKKNCDIAYDFSKTKTYANAHIKFTLTPAGVITAAFRTFKNLRNF